MKSVYHIPLGQNQNYRNALHFYPFREAEGGRGGKAYVKENKIKGVTRSSIATL